MKFKKPSINIVQNKRHLFWHMPNEAAIMKAVKVVGTVFLMTGLLFAFIGSIKYIVSINTTKEN